MLLVCYILGELLDCLCARVRWESCGCSSGESCCVLIIFMRCRVRRQLEFVFTSLCYLIRSLLLFINLLNFLFHCFVSVVCLVRLHSTTRHASKLDWASPANVVLRTPSDLFEQRVLVKKVPTEDTALTYSDPDSDNVRRSEFCWHFLCASAQLVALVQQPNADYLASEPLKVISIIGVPRRSFLQVGPDLEKLTVWTQPDERRNSNEQQQPTAHKKQQQEATVWLSRASGAA